MALLTVTAAQIAPVKPSRAFKDAYVAAATITAGQAVYLNTSGKVDLASAAASGTKQFLGIALNGGGAGQAIDVCTMGGVAGFTLSGIAYDGAVYLSDTAGSLADAAGTATVYVGRVRCDSSSNLVKFLDLMPRGQPW